MSVYYIAGYPVSDELYHHGIKGQRWGVRRYQNEDGSLTSAGKKRYLSPRAMQRDLNKIDKELAYNAGDLTKNIYKAYRKSEGTSLTDGTNMVDDKYLERAKNISSNVESLSKRRDALIKQAIESGYDVRAKDVSRATVRTGEIFTKAFVMVSTAGIYNPRFTTAIEGTKYTVKKK